MDTKSNVASTAMEADGENRAVQKFSINVLQLVKTAQMQHGLRHRDYTRYRRYCTARLRRLYKLLKFTPGRGKYSKRNVTENTVSDVRFLQMVLYMAERAWSHAMQKRQLPDGPTAHQRIYLLSQLRKAVKWATRFAKLCATKADSRTSLEAEAYLSYMRGTLLFEQDQNWATALINFRSARAVYEELGKYGNIENQVLCCERIEELEPSIRYCLHKVGDSNLHTSQLLDAGKMEGTGLDHFQAKLENTSDLTDLVGSGRDRNLEEVAFSEEYTHKGLGFQAESNFHSHLMHTLMESEVDVLLKKDWKYKWQSPAFNSSTFHWKGTGDNYVEVDRSSGYGLKEKLYKHWMGCYIKAGGNDFHSSRQRHFFSLCNSYRDIMYCARKGFYMKGHDEDSCVMDAYIVHILNHIYSTRNLVARNDSKLARKKDHNEMEMLHGGSFLDRGFTRPKVLLLLPFRSIAFHVVNRLIQLTPPSSKKNVEHFDRFLREFGDQCDNEMDMVENDASFDETVKAKLPMKPPDFQVLFSGNTSEEFMIGIKFTRGSIKLYNDFYSSDMIVASPVQVVHCIGKVEADKDKDVDYLSSIEVLIIDHADIIAMQNWSHVNSILEQINKIPSDQHGSDVMRVRPWYLDGHARFYRQTILLGSFLNPDMNASFNNLCLNYEGKVKFVTEFKGILAKVVIPVRQVFERFSASLAEVSDARFDYFIKKVFPKIKDSVQGGIMIFISCYFDFVRIRNFLKSQNASFCLLGEYVKQSDISRARCWFFKGQRKIMLYTERSHFYHRYKIRGIQNLIFYSLPDRKEFYPEIINMLDGARSMSCSVLFSRFDSLRLERIVGSASSERMLNSDRSMFVFC